MNGKLTALSGRRWKYQKNKRDVFYIHRSAHVDGFVVTDPEGEEHTVTAADADDEIINVCDFIDSGVYSAVVRAMLATAAIPKGWSPGSSTSWPTWPPTAPPVPLPLNGADLVYSVCLVSASGPTFHHANGLNGLSGKPERLADMIAAYRTPGILAVFAAVDDNGPGSSNFRYVDTTVWSGIRAKGQTP